MLEVLRDGPKSEQEIIAAVCTNINKASFPTEVAMKAEVRQAIGALKLEHRVWPEKGKYRITTKGTKSYG